MKQVIFAAALMFAFSFVPNSAQANVPAPQIVQVDNAMKPKIKIRLTWNDGFSVEIEISFMTAPGGNDNATGTLDAKANYASNARSATDVMSWSWGASNPSILRGATDIVVTKGATLPNGKTINVGDRLVMNGNEFSIKSPRDAASGLATGKR